MFTEMSIENEHVADKQGGSFEFLRGKAGHGDERNTVSLVVLDCWASLSYEDIAPARCRTTGKEA